MELAKVYFHQKSEEILAIQWLGTKVCQIPHGGYISHKDNAHRNGLSASMPRHRLMFLLQQA
jgi:hypothetical protein